MNTLEMLQALTENPKRKAVMLVDGDGNNVEHFDKKLRMAEVGIFGNIKWADNGENLIISTMDKKVWKIIETPKKLKEMSFGEAFYYFWNIDVNSAEFKSVMTGKDFSRNELDISLEEYMGKWTIKGIYEEEE